VKIWTRCCITISAVLVLANIAAYGANSTSSTISMSATVPSTDNLTCTGSGAFSTVTHGTPVTLAPISCSVTDNDANGVTMTVWVASGNAMTGSGTNAIAASALAVYTTGTTTGQTNLATQYTALSSTGWTGLASNPSGYGLDVATFANSDATYSSVPLNVQLTLPANTPADSYTGTLNITITPIS
jgi:hypothetical protein